MKLIYFLYSVINIFYIGNCSNFVEPKFKISLRMLNLMFRNKLLMNEISTAKTLLDDGANPYLDTGSLLVKLEQKKFFQAVRFCIEEEIEDVHFSHELLVRKFVCNQNASFPKYLIDWGADANSCFSELASSCLASGKSAAAKMIFESFGEALHDPFLSLVEEILETDTKMFRLIMSYGYDWRLKAVTLSQLLCKRCDAQKLRVLLCYWDDLHYQANECIVVAVSSGNDDCIKEVLSSGSNPHTRNEIATHIAIKESRASTLLILLQEAPLLHESQMPFLRHAICHSSVDIVRLLILHGCNVLALDLAALVTLKSAIQRKEKMQLLIEQEVPLGISEEILPQVDCKAVNILIDYGYHLTLCHIYHMMRNFLFATNARVKIAAASEKLLHSLLAIDSKYSLSLHSYPESILKAVCTALNMAVPNHRYTDYEVDQVNNLQLLLVELGVHPYFDGDCISEICIKFGNFIMAEFYILDMEILPEYSQGCLLLYKTFENLISRKEGPIYLVDILLIVGYSLDDRSRVSELIELCITSGNNQCLEKILARFEVDFCGDCDKIFSKIAKSRNINAFLILVAHGADPFRIAVAQEKLIAETFLRAIGYFGDRKESFYDEAGASICAICLDAIRMYQKILAHYDGNGLHEFHYECLKRWLQSSNLCPLCRSKILK